MQVHQLEQCTTLVGTVDYGGGYAYVGARNIWVISVLSSQFCCESTTTLRKKFNSNIVLS